VTAGAGAASALLVDLYELTMAQSYLDEGMHERPATFDLFTRKLPRGWGYMIAAGLEDVLAYLEGLRFTEDELSYLEGTRRFSASFLDHLRGVRFTGTVRAMPEGTPFLAHEPVLEITAPMLEAQLVESYVLNQVHLQSLIASKAVRSVEVAGGRTLVDFALRRAHGTDAGLKVARSTYLAGFDSTSNVAAGQEYGIPISGTMAHSYVEAFEDEIDAFRAFARVFPDTCILLIDTYDTVEGARRAAVVGREMAAAGHALRAVRLDSGDLVELAPRVRAILDEAGLADVGLFASGGLDEHVIARLVASSTPIGGFGVGSSVGVAADHPVLDMAYKIVAYDGRPVLKLSEGKATWPGAKQVYRPAPRNLRAADVIALAAEPAPAGCDPLLVPVMEEGRRIRRESLEVARGRCAASRGRIAPERRALDASPGEAVFSERLVALRDEVTATIRARHGLS
jgi:nicotinate phosphoribosyltransferase